MQGHVPVSVNERFAPHDKHTLTDEQLKQLYRQVVHWAYVELKYLPTGHEHKLLAFNVYNLIVVSHVAHYDEFVQDLQLEWHVTHNNVFAA